MRVVAERWIRQYLNGITRRPFLFSLHILVESHLLSTSYMRCRRAKPDNENHLNGPPRVRPEDRRMLSPTNIEMFVKVSKPDLNLISRRPFRLRRFPSVEGRARRGAYLGH